jgi:hypothetical protein
MALRPCSKSKRLPIITRRGTNARACPHRRLRLLGPSFDKLACAVRTIPRIEPSTLEQQLWDMGTQRRFQTWLFTLFALLPLALAAVGIYAVLSYSVSQGTRKIGNPHGARRATKRRAWDGFAPGHHASCPGLGGRAVLAVGCSRALGGLLYGVAATDPLTYLSVCVLLLVIASAACFVPASRAMRVDPLMSLRYE